MEVGQTFAIHCCCCGHTTQSEVVAVKPLSWTEPGNERIVFDYELEHSLLLCSQCRSAQMHSAKRVEQLFDGWIETYSPPHPVRPLPHWVAALPKDADHMLGLLKEVHVALANGHYWLVAMGCRTLVDMFALARVGDVGGFKAKLDRLQKDNYLTLRDIPVVEAVVEVGHEATHRNQYPSLEDCQRCLDIVENLLHRLVIDASASGIQEQRVKPRRRAT